jgi:hypothetical protein
VEGYEISPGEYALAKDGKMFKEPLSSYKDYMDVDYIVLLLVLCGAITGFVFITKRKIAERKC